MTESNSRTKHEKRFDLMRRYFPVVFAFFVLTFSVFGQTLHQGFVSFDDDILVYENPLVREISPTTIKGIFTTYDPELYIPLTFFSYQIDQLVGGGNPFLFHLSNLLLHTINSLLVTLLLFRLDKGKKWVAMGCGVIFAIHPLHTEAVAWISARKDQLSTMFYLLTMLAYLKHIRGEGKSALSFAFLFMLLGLLSKVMVITMPVTMVLMDYFERRKITRKTCFEKLPFFGLSIAFGLIALYGKKTMLATSTPETKILMAFKSSAFYLQKLFAPTHLSVVYPFDKEVNWLLPDFLIPIVVVSAIGILAFKYRKDAVVVFCLGFFFVAVAPTFLNFAKAGEIFVASDRYAYLPSIGIFFLVGVLLRRCAKRFAFLQKRSLRPFWFLMFAAVACSFALMSNHQVKVWENDEKFFTHALAFYPGSYVAQNNLGNALLLKEDYAGAIAAYESALKINPDSIRTIGNLALAYGRSGDLLAGFTQVAHGLNKAPRSAEMHIRLGDLHIMQGNNEEAFKAYQTASKLDPKLMEKKYYAIKSEAKL